MNTTTRTLTCLLCDPPQDFETQAAFTVHAVKGHGVDYQDLKRARATNADFLDGAGWASHARTFVLPDGRDVVTVADVAERRKGRR